MDCNILRLDRLSVQQTKNLNEISFRFRKEFNDFITQLSVPYAGNLDWLISSPASRDIYSSNLFRYFCDLLLIEQLLKKGEDYNLIIVDNSAFKIVLQDFLKQNDYKVKVRCRNGIFKSIFIAGKRFINVFINLFMRCYVSRGREASKIKPVEPITLVDCFILKSSIKGNKYQDRYYTGLFESINENEKQQFFYLPQYILGFRDFIKTFKKIRKLDQNFLIKDDFLKINDYLYASFYLFRILRIKIGGAQFNKFNMLPLIKHELYFSSANTSSFSALLNYRFARRLRERKVRVKKLINWKTKLLDLINKSNPLVIGNI